MIFLALGCAHPAPVVAPPPTMESPRLPSPVGDLYTRHRSTPGDPTVASVIDGGHWDEVLSGVAASVALDVVDNQDVDAYAVRWKAVRAGYPYPVRVEAILHGAVGGIPEDLRARVKAVIGSDIGLVRARGEDGDTWVLLSGNPRGLVPALAREHALGETIESVGLTIVDPLGQVRPAAPSVRLDMAGEWLAQAGLADDPIATFPLYVGEPTPEMPPILGTSAGAGPEEQARAVLARVWDWYGRGVPDFDPMLDSVARARLRDELDGTQVPAERQLHAAGYVGVPVGAAACHAADATRCLDDIWWSPERRGVLTGDFAAVGLATGVQDGQLVMVVVAAG